MDLYIEPEIQEYLDFIGDSDVIGENIITPQKIDKNFEKIGKAMNHFLAYPDIFLDIITPSDSKFKLFFFQRIMLRAMVRHRQTYITATRGASKSFTAFATRYQMAMSIPNHKTFVCTDVKEQAVSITREKVEDDLWVKFPLLKNEMIKIPQPGKPAKHPLLLVKDMLAMSFQVVENWTLFLLILLVVSVVIQVLLKRPLNKTQLN